MRGLWPGGGDEGRPCRSLEDVRGGEEVVGREEGVWGMRSPSILRELRQSRAVLRGWGGGRGQCRRVTREGGGVLRGERTVGAGQRVRGRGVRMALDGWEGMSVGAWVGGLVASIVGG